MVSISHAISSKSSSRLYISICKEPGHKDFEQRCLKVLEAYPQITSANDYLTFSRLFIKIVAIEKATKAQLQVKEMKNKYPSSKAIKLCADNYDTVFTELKAALSEDSNLISLDVQYAYDAVGVCERSLANEKSVDTSSISTLNNAMTFVIEIAGIASGHL